MCSAAFSPQVVRESFPVRARVFLAFCRVFHGNSQDDLLNCTREAMRSRLHFWAREIPIVSLEIHPLIFKLHPRLMRPLS